MIFLATPIGEHTILKNFLDSREDAIEYMTASGWRIMTEFYQGAYICANRNRAIFDVYGNKAEWLVFIDNDMVFRPDDIEKLIRYGGEVVAGVYKTGEGKYALYDYNDDRNEISAISELKDTVDAAGTGFMAIKNTVIERICSEETRDRKWTKTKVRDATLNFPFSMVTAMDCVQFGEDVSFCLRLRELGIPITVAKNVLVGHEKLIVLK